MEKWRLKLETLVLSKVVCKIQGNLVSMEMVGIDCSFDIVGTAYLYHQTQVVLAQPNFKIRITKFIGNLFY